MALSMGCAAHPATCSRCSGAAAGPSRLPKLRSAVLAAPRLSAGRLPLAGSVLIRVAAPGQDAGAPEDHATTSGRAVPPAEDPEAWQACSWPCCFERDYKLGEFIARGSFGRVYAATAARGGGRVAVKVLAKRREGVAAARYQEKVEKEVAVLEELQGSSDGVLALRGVYQDADNVYIITELATGGDLGAFLERHGRMTEREAARGLRTLVAALATCHARGILYGDVKPANFLLRAPYPPPPGAPTAPLDLVVADFGGVQRLDAGGGGVARPAGTPLYLAPEVFMCDYGAQSDVWGAGMLLHQLLTGDLPFVGGGGKLAPMELALAVMTGELDTSTPEWQRLSPEAQDLIARMLDRDPDARITPAQALAHPWFGAAAAADADEWLLPDALMRRAEPGAAASPRGPGRLANTI